MILTQMIMVLLAFSCSSQHLGKGLSGNNEAIVFDLSLIHTLSSNQTNADIHPATLPFYAFYKSGDKELIYLSTLHSSDVRSKTHQCIDDTLDRLIPKGGLPQEKWTLF